MSEVKVIKIRRVPKAGYFGIGAFSKAVETLGCELSANGHNTGLTAEEETLYEGKLGLKPGELGRHSKWWDEQFNVYHVLRLPKSKTYELILDNDINYLRYKVALASSKIANSELERNKPGYSFYIDDEEAKAKADLEVFNFEFEGMKMIINSTPEEKRGNLRLFGKKGTELMTETMLNSQLSMELKKDPKNFLTILSDKDVRTKALIKELEEKRIITRTGNTYKYGEDIIGASTEECVSYFNDIKNQHIVLVMQGKLKKSKKVVE